MISKSSFQSASSILAEASDGLVLGDAETIAFGNTTNGDFKIYHDGTNASIQNITGNLYLYGGGGAIYLRPSTDDEHGVVVAANAQVELYYNGIKKFETSNNGANLYGTLLPSADASYKAANSLDALRKRKSPLSGKFNKKRPEEAKDLPKKGKHYYFTDDGDLTVYDADKREFLDIKEAEAIST